MLANMPTAIEHRRQPPFAGIWGRHCLLSMGLLFLLGCALPQATIQSGASGGGVVAVDAPTVSMTQSPTFVEPENNGLGGAATSSTEGRGEGWGPPQSPIVWPAESNAATDLSVKLASGDTPSVREQSGSEANDEPLHPGLRSLPLPSISGQSTDAVQLTSANGRVTLNAVDAPLSGVLAMIAEQHSLNVVAAGVVDERITIKLTDTPLSDAFNVLLTANNYAWTWQKGIVIVSKISGDAKADAGMQGREIRVFNLNYLTATEADKVVQGLLSPVGQSFINSSLATDYRRTHEQLVVEDLPDNLYRVANYLAQADTQPTQVLIEAHVLQVTLTDNCRHGVNLQEAFQLANRKVTLATTGLATGLATASSLKIEGQEVNGLIEAIKATTDAKTLASPQIAVLNNQEASIQVGSKIGYLLTTTTQTSTLQSVNFLDVGVILRVTPSITADGQILIQAQPQVSTGRINATTQLPESETTELETRVLLGDGEAIVIGGLIKESDIESQNKIPLLGDLWLVGWLFQRREVTRERNEIIITLLPRIVPSISGCRELDPCQVERAHTPLLHGPLKRVDRSGFEPALPCATNRPRDR